MIHHKSIPKLIRHFGHLLYVSLFASLFYPNLSNAQKIYHSIGPSISLVESGVADVPLPYIAASYTARINVYDKQEYTVSIGVPAQIGALIFSSIGRKADFFAWEGYVISLPVVTNLNWGAGASTVSSKKLGYFIGAGPGYLYRKYADLNDHTELNGLAATVNTGLRFTVGRRPKKKKKYMELRASYTLPFQNPKQYLFGSHLLFFINGRK